MKKFIQWVMAATLVCGSSLFTACVTDYGDNPVTPKVRIAIDKENFPDDNFRAFLLGQDYGKDGVLTEREIMNITEMDVYDMEISSLQGIEYFTAYHTRHFEEHRISEALLRHELSYIARYYK